MACRGGGVGQPSDPPDNTYFNPVLQRDGVETAAEGYCTDVFTDAGIAFMRAHREEPFFLYLPYNAPHDPLLIDPKFVQPYLDMGLEEDTSKVYGMVANIDENVGRVMAALGELSLMSGTAGGLHDGQRRAAETHAALQRGRAGEGDALVDGGDPGALLPAVAGED